MHSSGHLKAPFWDGVDIIDVLIPALSIMLFRELQGAHNSSQSVLLRKRAKSLWSKFRNSISLQGIDVELYSTLEDTNIDVLFWPIERNHFDQHMGVAKKFQKLNKSVAFLVSTEEMCQLVSKENFPFIQVIVRRKAAYQLSNLGSVQVNVKEKYFRCLLYKVYQEILPITYLSFKILEKVTADFKINHLVVGYDIAVQGRLGGVFMKNRGVLTSCIMHGTLSFEYESKGHRVDKLYLFGENDDKKLSAYGIPSTSYEVVGAPYLDKLVGKTNTQGVFDQLIRKMNFEDLEGKVLIATSGPGTSISFEHHYVLLESFEKVIKKFPQVIFLIKLHRKDKMEYYERILQLKNVLVIPYDHDYSKNIFDWFISCDLLITGASTTGLEAQIMDVPVISYDLKGEINSTYYVSDGITEYCTSESKLEDCIHDIVIKKSGWRGKEHYDNVRKKYFFKVDGKSSERVALSIFQRLV